MTFILTNDDGIDAPGIRALLKAVNSQEVLIVAPRDHLSGCGHQVTTTQAIHVNRRSDNEYAIAGTPEIVSESHCHIFAQISNGYYLASMLEEISELMPTFPVLLLPCEKLQ